MMKVDHIGIAVNSIEKALPFYIHILGFSLLEIEEVSSEQVRIAILDAKNVKIELLEAMATDSPLAKSLEKRGEGLHHIALHVNSLEDQIAKLKQDNIQMINEVPKRGAQGKEIVFLHPHVGFGVLYELCANSRLGENHSG